MTFKNTIYAALAAIIGICFFATPSDSGSLSVHSSSDSLTLVSNQTFNDDVILQFGTGGTVHCLYETADANANLLLCAPPEGGATDVPGFVWGDASAENVDLGFFNGLTLPFIGVLSDDQVSYVYLGHDQSNAVIETNEGVITIPDGLSSAAASGVALTGTNAASGSANPLDITSSLGIMNGSDDYTSIDINITDANHTGASNTVQGVDISGITADADATEVGLQVGAGWDYGISSTSDIRTRELGTADAGTTTYDGADIELRGSAWDTDGSADTWDVVLRNDPISAASTATDFKILFSKNGAAPTNFFTFGNSGNFAATTSLNSLTGVVQSNNTVMTVKGWASDGATADGVILDAGTAFTTAGANLVSIRNANTEKAYFTKDGGIVVTGSSTPAVLTQAVATSGAPVGVTFTGAAHTGLTTLTEVNDIFFDLDRTVQHATGDIGTQRGVLIDPPTYSFVGPSTVTAAATFGISGVPQQGANATFSNAFGFLFGDLNGFTSDTSNDGITGFVMPPGIENEIGAVTTRAALAIGSPPAGVSLGNQTATLDSFGGLRIHELTAYSTTLTRTVTDAAALYIQGAPVSGGLVTFTNGPYSLFVDNGATRLDGSLTVGGLTTLSTTAAITASTTQTQGNGALTTTVNEVSVCANANDTVTLPTAVAGVIAYIFNNGAETLQVFPASGDAIDGGAANAAVTMTAGSNHTFIAHDATNWNRLNSTL